MNLPIEFEEVKTIFSIAKSTVDVIYTAYNRFKKEPDEDVKGCIKEAISILTKETQGEKSSHLEIFVKNTLLTPECELEPSTIFSFLKDIEQMTWRQLCLLEGFRRKDKEEIEISTSGDRDINDFSIETEIKQLIDLNYLHKGSDSPIRSYLATSFEHIHISELGTELSSLLEMQDVKLPEIGKAFGGGRVKDIRTIIY